MAQCKSCGRWFEDNLINCWPGWVCDRCETAEAANKEAAATRKAIENAAWETKQAAQNAKTQSDKEHFRTFLENRVGHPLILDDIWWHERLKTWVAKEEWLTEVNAAQKSLEKASGVSLLIFFPKHHIAEWRENHWFFGGSGITGQGNIIERGKCGFIKTFRTNDPIWFSEPKDFAPYKAVSVYLGKPMEDINFSDYLVLEEHNLIVYVPEIEKKLKDQMNDVSYYSYKFDPSKDVFYEEKSVYKKAIFGNSGYKNVRWEVPLSQLATRIPFDNTDIPYSFNPDAVSPIKTGGGTAAAASNAGEVAFEKGKKFFNNREFNNAIEAFTEAINLGCKDMSNAYYYRADEYRMTKQYDKAISDCTSAINLNKNNAAAYGTRGESYRMKSEYDKAINDCTKAIELNPKSAFAYGARGSAYRMKGNVKQAVSDLNKALELNPGNAFAKNELQKANAAGAPAVDDNDDSFFDEDDEGIPDEAIEEYNKGEKFLEDGNYEKAVEACTKAIKLGFWTSNPYVRRGNAYTWLDKWDLAIADYTEAIKIFEGERNFDPDFLYRHEIYRLRGDAHKVKSNLPDALKDLTKAVELLEAEINDFDCFADWEKGYPYLSRGKVYKAMGENDKALADFEIAVKYAPDDEDCKNALNEAKQPASEKSAAAKPKPADKSAAEKPAVEKTEAKPKFCHECGAKLKAGAKFCSECGAKTE